MRNERVRLQGWLIRTSRNLDFKWNLYLKVRGVWCGTLILTLLMTGCGSGSGERTQLKRYSQVGQFSLTERSGKVVTQDDLQGKIWIAHFFYSQCGNECLVLGRRMESIQSRLKGDEDVMLVSMSVDPSNDTPEFLSYFARQFNAHPDRWWFLTGEKIGLYNLIIDSFLLPASAELKSRDDLPRNFIHSEKFAIVDRHGFVRAYFDGMDSETPEKVMETIQILKEEFQ